MIRLNKAPIFGKDDFLKRSVFRNISAIALTAALLFTTMFTLSVFSNKAQAATFTPRLTCPDGSNKYYYNSNYNVFQKYGYGLPNCTAYAYGRAYEILGTEPKLSWNGAGQWYGYNQSNGYYKYGSTPKVGAIACWSYGGGGHVAVVEKIESNGTMTLSNSEWGGRTFYLTYAKTTDSNPGGNSWWNFQGYIYLIDSAQVVEPTATYKPGLYHTDTVINLRSGAGLNYSVLKTVSKNLQLTIPEVVYNDGYNWGRATVFGTKGWVALEYCSYVGAIPQPTTTAPTTVAPTTVAPTTVAPTTVAPTTVAPTTVAPTTVAPTTVAPTTVEPTTVAPTTEEPTTTPKSTRVLEYKKGLGTGDVDGNGRITITDATVMQQYLASMLVLNEEQQSWCDFDFNGVFNINDITSLQYYLSLDI